MDWAAFWIGVIAAYVVPAGAYGVFVLLWWAFGRAVGAGGGCYVCDRLKPLDQHRYTNLTRAVAEAAHRWFWSRRPAHKAAWAAHPMNPRTRRAP